ncbi:MAG: Hsp20/alpha crystallin family protein [Opitutaceae bacterium]|nr:Hsp20/alpha crystallin family protein [Opitutaceae bacterium]
MHTIIRSIKTKQSAPAFASAFRKPHYDCQEQTDALKLVVYVPGVDPAGIDLEVRGPDLVVTAPKSHQVRINWRAAHLEGAQRDYQLRLRLGFSLAYDALQAVLHGGVLTITIPKKSVVAATCAVA